MKALRMPIPALFTRMSILSVVRENFFHHAAYLFGIADVTADHRRARAGAPNFF